MTETKAQGRMEAGFCTGCGEPRPAGAGFCAKCGRAFDDAASSAAGVQPAGPAGLSAVTAPDVAVLGGATLLIAAPFFPFLSATAAFVGSVSRSGVEITSGEALVLAAVGVIAGLLGLRSLGKAKGRVPVLVGLVGLGLSIYYYVQIDERVRDIGTDIGFASIGAGIWMALAGSALIAVGAIAANRRRAR